MKWNLQRLAYSLIAHWSKVEYVDNNMISNKLNKLHHIDRYNRAQVVCLVTVGVHPIKNRFIRFTLSISYTLSDDEIYFLIKVWNDNFEKTNFFKEKLELLYVLYKAYFLHILHFHQQHRFQFHDRFSALMLRIHVITNIKVLLHDVEFLWAKHHQ